MKSLAVLVLLCCELFVHTNAKKEQPAKGAKLGKRLFQSDSNVPFPQANGREEQPAKLANVEKRFFQSDSIYLPGLVVSADEFDPYNIYSLCLHEICDGKNFFLITYKLVG